MAQPQPSISPLLAGLTCACPRCGKGRLFQRVLDMRERCESCALDYRFVDTGDGPAVFAIFVLGALVLGGALFVEFKFDPPLWVHFALWGVLTPLIAVGLLRFLKEALIAQQYRHNAEESRFV